MIYVMLVIRAEEHDLSSELLLFHHLYELGVHLYSVSPVYSVEPANPTVIPWEKQGGDAIILGVCVFVEC
jgi:hypothetical protein